MSRPNIKLDGKLIRKAAKLKNLKTDQQVVHKQLDPLMKAEERKAMLQYYGSGIWQGDHKAMRKNRV
ncbi:MAG TPA: hypothetical protein VGY31_03170 [Terriglobia bacterium]|nr:hypothetical protein [Terriglobia bacterium]